MHAVPTDIKAFYEEKAVVYKDLNTTLSARDRLVVQLMPAERTLRICDLGCGSGRFLRSIEKMGHAAVGVDISEAAITLAKDSGVKAFVGNPETGEGLESVGDDFDVVTALDVLEHTFAPQTVLNRMGSLSRTNGTLIVSVPNAGCLPIRLILALGLAPVRNAGVFDSGHVQWFTYRSLQKLARECGWNVTQVKATSLPGFSGFGLWRTERLQAAFFRRIATWFPAAWGYQLIVRLDRVGGA